MLKDYHAVFRSLSYSNFNVLPMFLKLKVIAFCRVLQKTKIFTNR